MKKYFRAIAASAALGGLALAVGNSTAAAGHQVNPAKTIVVTVVGSKISNASAGGVIVGSTLRAGTLAVDFECPGGTTLARGRISSAAGSTGWKTQATRGKGSRGASKPGTIVFTSVPLATNTTLQTLCPANKKGAAFTQVSLELTAECVAKGGAKQQSSAQFPQMMRLDCDQLEVDSMPTGNTFLHVCPAGYVLKNKPTLNQEVSSAGWGNAAICVRKP